MEPTQQIRQSALLAQDDTAVKLKSQIIPKSSKDRTQDPLMGSPALYHLTHQALDKLTRCALLYYTMAWIEPGL